MGVLVNSYGKAQQCRDNKNACLNMFSDRHSLWSADVAPSGQAKA
ncbi:hypothetical protein [Neisseria canis]|nr:hypothetical protein [Neisseria canis]